MMISRSLPDFRIIFNKKDYHYDQLYFNKSGDKVIYSNTYIQPEDIHFLGFEPLKEKDFKKIISFLFELKFIYEN